MIKSKTKLTSYLPAMICLFLLVFSLVAFAAFPDEDYRYHRGLPESFRDNTSNTSAGNVQSPGAIPVQNAPNVVIVPGNEAQKLIKKLFAKADYKDLKKYDKPAIPFTIPTVNP